MADRSCAFGLPACSTLLLILVLVCSVILAAPLAAMATLYLSYEGVTKTIAVRGVGGTIKIPVLPYIGTGSNNHRDYMLYVNLKNFQAMGAGAYAYKSGSIVVISAAGYYYDANGAIHTIHNYPIPVNTGFTAIVKQTAQTSNCWKWNTYGGNTHTRCFAQSTYPINNIGVTAQTVSPYAYQANVNDMPGLFDSLVAGYWSGGYLVLDDYFSSSSTNGYKCHSLNGYVMDYLASYTGSSSKTDKVGVGPRYYTVDDCTNNNTGWAMFGE